MPALKHMGGRQDIKTPPEFLKAVQSTWGPIGLDCAAHKNNHIVPKYLGHKGLRENALSEDWTLGISKNKLRWLNPPFKGIRPWAEKCIEQSSMHKLRITMLVPANVTTHWFWDCVYPYAQVLALTPVLNFDKTHPTEGKPGGMILCLYGMGNAGKFNRWNWREYG